MRKYQLSTSIIRVSYVIRSPEYQIIANQILWQASLELNQKSNPSDSHKLEHQEIDLILGINWIEYHRASLDIAPRIVHLDSPFHGPDTLDVKATLTMYNSDNHILILWANFEASPLLVI